MESSNYLKRMMQGEAIIRFGHLWYGTDTATTVTGVTFSPSRQLQTVRNLRTDAALAFSPKRKPQEKTVVVTIVVSYSVFETHVQEFEAMLRITPIIEVQSSLISALIDPGSIRGNDSVPPTIFMAVDNVEYATIDEAPRDIKMTIVMTKVATPFLDDDAERYVTSLDAAIRQAEIIAKMKSYCGDSPATEAIATMLGVNVTQYQQMILLMRNRGRTLPLYSSKAVMRRADTIVMVGTFVSMVRSTSTVYIAPLDTMVGVPIVGEGTVAWYVSPGSVCLCELSSTCTDTGSYRAHAASVISLGAGEAKRLLPLTEYSVGKFLAKSTKPVFVKE